LNSKPFLEKDSPCNECLVMPACSEWCYKVNDHLRYLGVEQVYIMNCIDNHEFEKPAGDLFFGYIQNCPVCKTDLTGIKAARWL